MAKEDNRDIRIDSPYFSQAALAADAIVAKKNPQTISEIASGVHSFGAYALTNEFEYQDEGIPFLRGTNYAGDFVNFAGVLRISPEAHQLLHKSEVLPGMVLLSMSGSVGSVAVALDSWNYPINSNQDIAKIIPSSVNPFYLAAFLSSSFGRTQINRLPVGSVQQHIFLWMIERIQVPRFSFSFEAAVARITQTAYESHEMVSQYFAEADDTLLEALGLEDWTPPEPLSYTARASDTLSAGRLDARFFAPRIPALLDILNRDGCTVGDLATPRRQKFDSGGCERFHYIEIGDIDGVGSAGSTQLACVDAPSRATWHVKPNDVITSTVRPIRRLSAQIALEQDDYVCSSGFVVIQPHSIAPELLMAYLRLPVICELLDLYASASMYPAISDAHIFGLPIPEIDAAVELQIVGQVHAAKATKAQVGTLLETAKRAVEIALEDGEAPAMNFLDQAEGAS